MPNNRNLSLLAVAVSTPGLMAANAPSTTSVPAAASDLLHSLSTAVEADARANLKTQILTIDPAEKVRAVGAKVLLTRMAATTMTTPIAGKGTGSVGRTNTDIPECQSLSANWPVTIAGSTGFNGQHCVALKFGSASMDGQYPGGFEVIGRNLLVYLATTGSDGQLATLLFSNPASRKGIGNGAFEFIEGGTSNDDGTATFGTKNGC